MDTASVRIRGYQPGDLADLYRICLLTADSGRDATALYTDPRLPGEIYAAPYGVFEPGLAFVAEDDEGVGGYVLGALDTAAFEERLERDWWPATRLAHPEPSPEVAAGLTPIAGYALHDIHHPWTTPVKLNRRYPSHLHIDLRPRLQGQGLGRKLIAALLEQLARQGSRGLHLKVGRDNKRAVAFYRHLGFAEYPAATLGPEFPASHLHVFTLKLSARA